MKYNLPLKNFYLFHYPMRLINLAVIQIITHAGKKTFMQNSLIYIVCFGIMQKI